LSIGIIMAILGLIHVDINNFRVHVHVDVHCYILIILIELGHALTEVLVYAERRRWTDKVVLVLNVVGRLCRRLKF